MEIVYGIVYQIRRISTVVRPNIMAILNSSAVLIIILGFVGGFIGSLFSIPTISSISFTLSKILIYVISALPIIWIIGRFFPVYDAPSTDHGSATWIDEQRIRAYLQPRGLIIGVSPLSNMKNFDPQSTAYQLDDQRHQLMRYSEPGNALVVAPSRTGKGASVIIGNLLDWEGGIIATDPKGENYAITKRERERKGQQVLAFAPFPVNGIQSCAINPFEWMRSGDELDEDCRTIAAALIPRDPTEKDKHFTDNARIILCGFINYVAKKEPLEYKNLGRVRDLLNKPEKSMTSFLEDKLYDAGPQCADAAGLLLRVGDRERGSFFSTLTRFLGWWTISPSIPRLLTRNDVDWAALAAGKLSLYICIPESKMEDCQPLIRLLVVMAMESISHASQKPSIDVLFCLDELKKSVGYLEQIETLYEFGGMGWKCLSVFQDLGQIEKTYPNPRLFTSCALQIYFGIADLETAKMLSERLGKGTISTNSTSTSTTRNEVTVSNSQSEMGRELMTPDEIMSLPPNIILAFMRGERPVLCDQARYYQHRHFEGRWDTPPKL